MVRDWTSAPALGLERVPRASRQIIIATRQVFSWHLDNGYLTWVDGPAYALNYFSYPYYDSDAVLYGEEFKQAFSIGEFLTFASGNSDTSSFKGAALTISAETDYIVCDGYCPGIYDETARTDYREAKKLVTALHPNASHNINFHYNATGAYDVLLSFLDANL